MLEVLRDAARRFDRSPRIQAGARRAARRGFQGGAEWMALALSEIRGAPVVPSRVGAARLGLVKYGLATCLAALVVAAAAALEAWKLLPLAVVAFYLVEAQAAFVFPAFVDGVASPWGRSRELVRAAGGTVVVAGATLVIAWVMLGGGLAGKGFLRSWCIGCLAVVLWYERLRP